MIEQKVKDIFGQKGKFAEFLGVKPQNVNSKINTIYNQINKSKEFLKPLDLDVVLIDKGKWTVNGNTLEEMTDKEKNDLVNYIKNN